MSWNLTCDRCGGEITGHDAYAECHTKFFAPIGATLSQQDEAKEKGGWLGHYHSDDCWPRMRDSVEFMHAAAQGVAVIPTVSVASKPAEPEPRAPTGSTPYLAACKRARQAGGISALSLDLPGYQALVRAGVATVQQLQPLVESGKLIEVHGIGPKRYRAIQAALETWTHEQKATT